eukprot:CAMPEP_0117435016 /NCGR_PEP_ID=MMETSP0759-20121206/255_1 /TAXON_ID=63605 /ORGANISM="Percolomonas cosmopolitus, Strain WS" /LENGTH=506 /DNA_ID=CAMNT_0005226533 /DNA_START=275 /DNA_END=1795 /DNA_ORIENTATION=-
MRLVELARKINSRANVTRKHKSLVEEFILKEEQRTGKFPSDVAQLCDLCGASLKHDIPRHQLYKVVELRLVALSRKRITKEHRKIMRDCIRESPPGMAELSTIVDDLMDMDEFRDAGIVRGAIYHALKEEYIKEHRRSLTQEQRIRLRECLEGRDLDDLSISRVEQEMRSHLGDMPMLLVQHFIREGIRSARKRSTHDLGHQIKHFLEKHEIDTKSVEALSQEFIAQQTVSSLHTNQILPIMSQELNRRITPLVHRKYRNTIRSHVQASAAHHSQIDVDQMCKELENHVNLPTQTLRTFVDKEVTRMERTDFTKKYQGLVQDHLRSTTSEDLENPRLLCEQVQERIQKLEPNNYIPNRSQIYRLVVTELLRQNRRSITEQDSKVVHDYLIKKLPALELNTAQIGNQVHSLLPHLTRRAVSRLVQQEMMKLHRSALTEEQRATIARHCNQHGDNKSIPELCDELQKHQMDVPRNLLFQLIRSALTKKRRREGKQQDNLDQATTPQRM